MRVLFMSTPVSTHFAPSIPLGWALRAAGHEVLVAGQPDILGAAHGAGLCTAVVGEYFDALEPLTSSLPEGKRPIEVGHTRVRDGHWDDVNKIWLIHCRYLVSRYIELAREWKPDLIVADPLEFSALLVGGVLGVPTVNRRWGVDPAGVPGQEMAARTMGTMLGRLGLDALPRPALVLDPCPPSLQVPEAPPSQGMRYIPFNGAGSLPDWAREKPRGHRRVCVSFGRLTAAMNGIPLFRTVVEAAGGLDGVETILTLEPEFREALGPVPPSVRAVDPAPLNLFLDTCDAVVHHGGAGSTLTTTAFGLPHLVLPGITDTFVVADRVVATGVGRTVDEAGPQNDPEVVRETLRGLLDDPGHAQAATKLRDEVLAMPTPAEVVPILEELAG
ncbi:nucleotide disphospho-sugar-binding domain-containing protein [Actinokineospora sp. NBRC 105648]|uniref:nucleotide disphospho-sugar-binding domain-containing protein n=1 Tax=Actinokineospora sp. NBRC 105648 TaxID=3032206 RepID=UPI0024A186A0|nr:nucleotide disphospho-sugar-binding domain-containing protein [Actinokineospora sp. NBRC 105648]GLZ36623.1 glycosyl transferase [Actinokineospora sp. NBRC 105648]